MRNWKPRYIAAGLLALAIAGLLVACAVVSLTPAPRGDYEFAPPPPNQFRVLARHRRPRPTTSVTTTIPSTTTAPVTTTTVTTTPAGPLPPNPLAPRQLGVSLAWSTHFLADLDAYSALVGRVPSIVNTYRDFNGSMLDTNLISALDQRGITSMLTIEPWDSSSATDPRYTLKNITRGDFDAWFAAGAEAAKSYGKPFYLRFAPEMNGKWAPWEAGINGNTPQDFIDAWRHVHALFAAHGVVNALWVFCPNEFTAYGPAVDFTPYYPGSDVVDVLALDGYNWGTLDVWQTWSQVFGSPYDKLAVLDAVAPMMIGETAANENGGDKAAWITSAYMTEIPARTPRIKAVVWFNLNKEADWRVQSSAASLSAFRAIVLSGAWG